MANKTVIVNVELQIRDFGEVSDPVGRDKKVYLSKRNGNIQGRIMNPDVLVKEGFKLEYGQHKGSINVVMIPQERKPLVLDNNEDADLPEWLDRYDPAVSKQLVAYHKQGEGIRRINKALGKQGLPKVKNEEWKQLDAKPEPKPSVSLLDLE